MTSTQTLHEQSERALQLLCTASKVDAAHLYMLSDRGLLLTASHGAAPAPAVTVVRAYLDATLEQSAMISEMMTGALTDEPAQSNMVHVSDKAYELLLLTSPSEEARRIAGVVAIERGSGDRHLAERLQIMQLLAKHFLARSDTAEISGALS